MPPTKIVTLDALKKCKKPKCGARPDIIAHDNGCMIAKRSSQRKPGLFIFEVTPETTKEVIQTLVNTVTDCPNNFDAGVFVESNHFVFVSNVINGTKVVEEEIFSNFFLSRHRHVALISELDLHHEKKYLAKSYNLYKNETASTVLLTSSKVRSYSIKSLFPDFDMEVYFS